MSLIHTETGRSQLRRPKLAISVLLIILLGVIAVLAQPARVAFAASITVTTTTDEMTDNATCSLREAIIAANTNSNAHENACTAGSDSNTDTITLATGATYSLTIDGNAEDASATGDLDIL